MCHSLVAYQERKDRVGEYRKVRFCDTCRPLARAESHKRIQEEKGNLVNDKVSKMTKAELLEHFSGNPYRFKVKVNNHAHYVWEKLDKSNVCYECGFQHIDVCHIKDVKDFGMDATIGEINAPENLIGLCPNHHWMFDRGLLEIK